MIICFKVDFETRMGDLSPKERKILGRLRGLADLNRRICLKLTPKDPDLLELTSDTGDWTLAPTGEEDWSELPK
jgi:hypothetical protein